MTPYNPFRFSLLHHRETLFSLRLPGVFLSFLFFLTPKWKRKEIQNSSFVKLDKLAGLSVRPYCVCSTVPRECGSKLCITYIIWKEKERTNERKERDTLSTLSSLFSIGCAGDVVAGEEAKKKMRPRPAKEDTNLTANEMGPADVPRHPVVVL